MYRLLTLSANAINKAIKLAPDILNGRVPRANESYGILYSDYRIPLAAKLVGCRALGIGKEITEFGVGKRWI